MFLYVTVTLVSKRKTIPVNLTIQADWFGIQLPLPMDSIKKLTKRSYLLLLKADYLNKLENLFFL